MTDVEGMRTWICTGRVDFFGGVLTGVCSLGIPRRISRYDGDLPPSLSFLRPGASKAFNDPPILRERGTIMPRSRGGSPSRWRAG